MSSQHTHVLRELRRQPECWARALALVPDLADALPRAGERIAVLGSGTSWFMAIAYAGLREAAGLGETDAFATSEFRAARQYDRIVLISRSGTTTEAIRAIAAATAPVTALTAVADSPVAQAARHAIVLDFADEQSVVQTVFATTALMLLRGSLGKPLDRVVAQATDVLAAEAAGAAPPADVERARQFTFLGSGWVYGVALEAGLKLREAAQLWTESYPQLEYRHGPISIAQPGRAVWLFGTPEEGILRDVRATGATVLAQDLDPVADLIRVQALAVRRAQADGLNPDQPRALTRSVVLGQDQ
jgi:fructoselysine-6-P-deglycase FrlB-like protein